MRKLTFILLFIPLIGSAQSIDFGVEVRANYNYLQKFTYSEPYAHENISVSVVDMVGDTSNVYLYKFGYENNFEIPLYFRFNMRKRWFFEAKLSNSVNTITMEGLSNYNPNYYTSTYGSYDQFIADAVSNGFTNADSSDYTNYINSFVQQNESEVRTVENFKLLNFGFNGGIRLFPHKSVKLILGAGMSFRVKYRKHLYNYVDFSNPYIQDIRSVESGLDWFAERSTFLNFMVGLELYRFRLSAFAQTGISYRFPGLNAAPEVTYVAGFTPFDVVQTYGFSMSANLFSLDIGKNVKKDEVSSDDVILSNIKKKKELFDIGFRYDRRGFNDMYTYYDIPEDRLTVMTLDSMIYNNGSQFVNAFDMELMQLGDIKRIDWSGRFNGFVNIYLSRRFGLRGNMGLSRLTYDIESTELKATIVDDSTGINYLLATNTPSVRRAVYRRTVNVLDVGFDVTYRAVDRDLFSLTLFAGTGFSVAGAARTIKNGNQQGVNNMDIYDEFENWFETNTEKNFDLYQGDLYVDLANPPDQLISTVQQGSTNEFTLDPAARRIYYPTFRFGFDANFERYMVGFGMDMSIGEMDRFLVKEYSSIYMSVGYKIWRR